MKNPILHIPSVITQSCFTDVDGEVVDIKESEINYFYLLLFLYREELLQQTPNLLLQNGNRYHFNEMIKYNSVDIEMYQFQQYGVVSNYEYGGIKSFIDNLSKLFINVNLFRKNKDKDVECIKMIESHSWDSTLLTINFTKEFVKELIGVEKFFMEVDLNNLFNLNGSKTKYLYLLLKDYSRSGNKDLTKEELMILIGKIPQKSIFDSGIIKQITDETDIKVSYDVVGKKKKTYKFKIKNKVNLKSTSKSKSSKPKEEINTEVMEKSKKKIQQMKSKGKKFDNENGYLQTIYKNEMEKLKPQPQKEKTEDDLKVEEWIQTKISMLKQTENIQYQHNNYLMLCIEKDGREDELFIDDDYKVYNRVDYEKQNPITSSSEVTNRFLEYYEDEITPKVFCGYSSNLTDKTISEIRRD